MARNHRLFWQPDGSGGYFAGHYRVYEVRPGVWRAYRENKGQYRTVLINPGTTLDAAKADCEAWQNTWGARNAHRREKVMQ